MKKKTLGVIFGGCSTEYPVSLQSAYAVLTHLKQDKYDIIPIGISNNGDWYRYSGEYGRIRSDRWLEDSAHLTPVTISQNPGIRGMLEQHQDGITLIPLDLIFPVLHGKNGEDGRVQGLFELAAIPIVGCGSLSSALCMDKHKAHTIVNSLGIPVPRSVVISRPLSREHLLHSTQHLRYPLFIKPLRSGSSFGITKIYRENELLKAVQLAFEHDLDVIIEENIEGFEVGCAVLGNNSLITGNIDEIELTDGFFDFTEKYTLKRTKIHMPARIDTALEEKIRDTACLIYRALDCSCFARVDMFLTPDDRIFFNEVNTIPGFTPHSRYPNMMKGIGLEFTDLLDRLIQSGEER